MVKTSIHQKLLTLLLIPILLALGADQEFVTGQTLGFEYAKAGFPPNPYSFNQSERLGYASTQIGWMLERQPIEALAVQKLDDIQGVIKHVQELQIVFRITRHIWHLALGLLVLIVYMTLLYERFLWTLLNK